MTVYPEIHGILGHGTCNVCHTEYEYTDATGFSSMSEPCPKACGGTVLKW